MVTNSFTPTSNVTTITFAFQADNTSGTWDLDSVSLKQSSGVELMQNGGFESGSLLPHWISSCTTLCTGVNGGGPGSISSMYPQSGTYHYRDRCNPVPNFDYLSQTIIGVVPNQLCTLQYYLALNYTVTNISNNFYVLVTY